MKLHPHRLRPVGACALAAVLAGLTHPAPAADINQSFRTEAVALRADLVEIDKAWHEVLGWMAANTEPVETVDFALQGGIDGKDLYVRVYRVGERVIYARGWAPSWNDAEHTVDARELVLEGAKKSTAVSGSLHVRFEWDGYIPLDGKTIDGWFNLEGTLDDGRMIRGKFATFVPEKEQSRIAARRGVLSAVLHRHRAAVPRPENLPLPPIKWGAYTAYRRCRQMTQRAENLYQLVRAAAIAVDSGLPYSRAVRQVVPVTLHAPDYDPPRLAKKKKREKTNFTPTLDDFDDGIGLDGAMGYGDDNPAEEADDPAGDPKTPEALARLKHMRARVARQRALVLARAEAGPQPRTVALTNGEDPRDVLFHPWYKTRLSLAVAEGGGHVLPDDAGAEGPQDWAGLRAWRFVGPFPIGEWMPRFGLRGARNDPATYPEWTSLTPGLPEVVAGPDFHMIGHPFDFGSRGQRRSSWGGRKLTWKALEPYDAFGRMAPPFVAARNPFYGRCLLPPGAKDAGMDMAAFLFECDIRAPRDVELWTAICLQSRGVLWLNGKRLWAGPRDWKRTWLVNGSPRPAESRAGSAVFLKIPFRKGANTLRFRLENGFCSTYFWMRLCTRGRPKPAAESRAFLAGVDQARKSLPPPTTGCSLRGDQDGVFNDAVPPLAWNLKRRQNIRWYTPLPYWSNGSPVLAGDRLFVPVEPDRLYCLSKDDGRILWMRTCNAIHTLSDPEKEKGLKLYEAWWKARIERDKHADQFERPPKWIRNSNMYYWEEEVRAADAEDEREGASPELVALLDKRDELQSDPDPESVQNELNAVLKRIDTMKAKLKKDDPEFIAAQKLADACKDANGALIKFLGQHFGVGKLDGYWYDYDGYQFSTPITDGKHVWLKTGFGALACFDMEGNRRFIVPHGGLGAGSATISSPLLNDGRIIMKVNRLEPGQSRGRGKPYVVAFDAATGEERWSSPARGAGWGSGSPLALRLTNGKDAMTVILTDGGTLLRADDGKVLVDSIGAKNDSVMALLEDDTVVFAASPPMTAFRFVMIDRDTVSFRPLWRRADRCQYHSAVLQNGIIYMPGGGGVPNTETERWAGLRTFRVTDGYRLNSITLLRKGGNWWSQGVASRDFVYHYGGDNLFAGAGNKQPMTLAVIEKGERGDLLALNAVERSYSAPVLEGERLYMRGYQGIFCAEYTGDEGKAYEARHVAQTLLDQVSAARPTDGPVLETTPRGFPGRTRRLALKSGFAPGRWLFAGPFAAGATPPVLKELYERERWSAPDAAAGTGWTLQPLNRGNVPGHNAHPWIVDSKTLTLVDRQRRRVVDVARAFELKPNTVVYLYAEQVNPAQRIVQYEQTTPGIRSWVNGVEIEHGQRCGLAAGTVSLLLEIAIGDTAPAELPVSPRFWNSADPAAEAAAWKAFATRHRSRLEAAVKLAPGTPEAHRAQSVLAQLGMAASDTGISH